MKRFLKHLRELRYRYSNYRYWRARGVPMRRAWAKASLTL